MSADETFVLDASVGVKWFRSELGSQRARQIVHDATAGRIRVVVPTHFVHEVLSVMERRNDSAAIIDAWELIAAARIEIVPLSDAVVREAARQCDGLGCSFYDALAPAVATLIDSKLVSADLTAHHAYPRVEMLGQ